MGIGGFGTGPASKSATELRPGGRRPGAVELIRFLQLGAGCDLRPAFRRGAVGLDVVRPRIDVPWLAQTGFAVIPFFSAAKILGA
jgi:hypothetical protein